VQRRLAQIEESVARYLSELDSADRQGTAPVAEARTARLREKVEKLQSEMQRMKVLAQEVEAAPDNWLAWIGRLHCSTRSASKGSCGS
jgi:uncharacterized protein YigA (DUF484 family)